MLRLIAAVLALLTAGVVYFVRLLYQKRKELEGLVSCFDCWTSAVNLLKLLRNIQLTEDVQPCPPMESIFWGHLPIAGECRKLFPPNVHMQSWANYIRKKYDLGG